MFTTAPRQPLLAQLVEVLPPQANGQPPHPTVQMTAPEEVSLYTRAAMASQPQQQQQQQQQLVAQPQQPQQLSQARVIVPTGIGPGQQLAFVSPDGQNLSVTVEEATPPGGMVTVHYKPLSNASGVPGVVSHTMVPATPTELPNLRVPNDADRNAGNMNWMLYAAGWVACCCVPIAAPAIWLGIACVYFCKSPQQRAQRPSQRAPALASAITCSVISALMVLAFVGACVMGLVISTMPPDAFGPGNHTMPPDGFGSSFFHGLPGHETKWMHDHVGQHDHSDSLHWHPDDKHDPLHAHLHRFREMVFGRHHAEEERFPADGPSADVPMGNDGPIPFDGPSPGMPETSPSRPAEASDVIVI